MHLKPTAVIIFGITFANAFPISSGAAQLEARKARLPFLPEKHGKLPSWATSMGSGPSNKDTLPKTSKSSKFPRSTHDLEKRANILKLPHGNSGSGFKTGGSPYIKGALSHTKHDKRDAKFDMRGGGKGARPDRGQGRNWVFFPSETKGLGVKVGTGKDTVDPGKEIGDRLGALRGVLGKAS